MKRIAAIVPRLQWCLDGASGLIASSLTAFADDSPISFKIVEMASGQSSARPWRLQLLLDSAQSLFLGFVSTPEEVRSPAPQIRTRMPFTPAKYGSDAMQRLAGEAEQRPLLTIGVALGIGILIGAAVLGSTSGGRSGRRRVANAASTSNLVHICTLNAV